MSGSRDDFDRESEIGFDRNPSRPAKGRSNAGIIIAVVLGFGALAGLVCCGGGVYFLGDMAINDVPAAQTAAEAFFADLQAGRIPEAYAGTATAFQQATTEEQFRALLDVSPAATNHTSRTIQLVNMRGGTGGGNAVFRVTIQSPGGPGGCTLTMFKEAGEWKVAGLNLDASMMKPAAKPDAPSPAKADESN